MYISLNFTTLYSVICSGYLWFENRQLQCFHNHLNTGTKPQNRRTAQSRSQRWDLPCHVTVVSATLSHCNSCLSEVRGAHIFLPRDATEPPDSATPDNTLAHCLGAVWNSEIISKKKHKKVKGKKAPSSLQKSPLSAKGRAEAGRQGPPGHRLQQRWPRPGQSAVLGHLVEREDCGWRASANCNNSTVS